MTFQAILEFLTEMARLGASPEVQEYAHKFFAHQLGLAAGVVTAAVQANVKEASGLPPPTV